jgi:hypothetical protein
LQVEEAMTNTSPALWTWKPTFVKKTDTPPDIKYPWLKTVNEITSVLPEHPTDRDHAQFYASVLLVYQQQRQAFLDHMTHRTMPVWAWMLTTAVAIDTAAIIAIITTLVRLHAFSPH